jgi:hypothetical protein
VERLALNWNIDSIKKTAVRNSCEVSVCAVTGPGLIVLFQRWNEKGSLGNLWRKVQVIPLVLGDHVLVAGGHVGCGLVQHNSAVIRVLSVTTVAFPDRRPLFSPCTWFVPPRDGVA